MRPDAIGDDDKVGGSGGECVGGGVGVGGAVAADFVFGHGHIGGGEGIGQCGGGGCGPAAGPGLGGLSGAGVDDVVAFDCEAGGTEGGVGEGEAEGFAVWADGDGPGGLVGRGVEG